MVLWGLVGLGLLVLLALVARSLRPRRRLPSVAASGAAASFIPDSKFVSVDGVRLHYVQAGRGPDLVLIHGIGASVFIWRFLFPLLQTRYQVTALDLAGFGKSEKHRERDYGLDAQAQLVADALTAIGIKHAGLVGSSMGGAIALWLARRDEKRFSKVAALAPATDSRLVPGVYAYVRSLFSASAPLVRRALNRHSMKFFLGRVLARRERLTDDAVDAYLAPFLEGADALRAFSAAVGLLADPRLPSGLKGLGVNVLVVYGERDRLVPERSIKLLTDLLPRATLVTHPTAGHHMMEDEPDWTFAQLDAFFSRR